MMRLPIAVSFRLLVLLALGERAAANLVLNPYTERGVPPPGRIPCMTDDDCKASAFCGPTDAERSSASCPTDQSEDLQPDGKYSCIEWWIVPGTHGTPTNACDNPKANGFEDCWSDVAQAERGSDERLKRFCSPRNRDGGMYWNSELPPPPPSPPPRSPPPSTPPPDFSNTTEGQLTYGSGALIFLLVIGLVSYLVHVRAKVDAQRISQWASREGTGGPMRKGVGAALTFFIRWICLEAGLEVVVECFNGLASANATLGSPTSFYITCIINLAMILLETSEVCLTRKHGGKQTPWDCFLFGQWLDATRKNYYAKYSARVVLFIHLIVNASVFPSVVDLTALQTSDKDVADLKNAKVQSAQLIAGFNSFKLFMGLFMLVDTVGVTLLEPLLAALPKSLQCLRVGPLASPGRYSARDFAITNLLSLWCGTAYLVLAYKNLVYCGWSPDAFPWNEPGYPSAERTCADMPQTLFEELSRGFSLGNSGMVIGFITTIVGPLGCTCAVLRLARKLPGWGEPPASDKEASGSAITKPPLDAKVPVKV